MAGLGWQECVCGVGCQLCGVHPGRLRRTEEKREKKIAFRKSWDVRLDEAKGRDHDGRL